MPMYADLLEAGQEPSLEFALPYDQPDEKPNPLDEAEQLAEQLYGDGEKAPSNQRRVYSLEEYAPTLQNRLGKRKRLLDPVEEADEEADPEDDKRRPGALVLHGEPISKLGTEKIFEYVATYCDKPPNSLEWIDDRTTVIVFESSQDAQSALGALSRSGSEDDETLVPAQPVPKKMWPPEAQLDHNLSRGTVLSGVMHVRWARFGDRKLKDARKRSEWYQLQRQSRGKRIRAGGRDDGMDLDAELDEMQRRREAGEDDLQDKESAGDLRNRLGPRKDRQIAPLPRRRGRGGDRERPKPTQGDLDAELEAFMKARE